MGIELLSPTDEYYIQLSYYSLIAIFQKTGFMHIQACRKKVPFKQQYFLTNIIFLPKFRTKFVLRCAANILKIGK